MTQTAAIGRGLKTQRPWAVERPLLLGVLVVGLSLRLVGTTYGLPDVFTSLESSVIAQSLKLAKTRSLIPESYEYLPFVKYFHAGLFGAWYGFLRVTGSVPSADAFERLYFLNPTGFFLISRLANVALGTLTVWLTYLFGRRAFGRTAALIAAGLVAANTIHVIDSHFGLTDVPMTAMAALTLVFLLRAVESPYMSLKPWALAGASMALAVSFKQTGGILLFPFIAALLLQRYQISERSPGGGRFLRGALAGLGAFLVLGAVFNVGAVLDWTSFLKAQLERLAMGGYVHSVKYETAIAGWRFYLETGLWKGFGPVGIAFGALGILLGFTYRSRADLLLLALIVPYGFLICWASFHQTRYLNLLVPPLALLIGRAVSYAFRGLKPPRSYSRAAAFGLVVIGLLGWPLSNSVALDYRLTQPDTRTLAKEWLLKNVGAGEPILVLAARPGFAPSLLPDREAARLQSSFQPSGKLSWLLSLPEGDYPAEGRHVIYVSRSEEYAAFSDSGFPFIVTAEAPGRSAFFRIMHPDHIHSVQSHEFFRHDPGIQSRLAASYRAVEEFSPSGRNLGFKVTIYRMQAIGRR